MSSSIADLLPSISSLSQQEKLQLVQLVLAQLEQEASFATQKSSEQLKPFEPNDFRGVLEVSKEEIDKYLRECREGWM